MTATITWFSKRIKRTTFQRLDNQEGTYSNFLISLKKTYMSLIILHIGVETLEATTWKEVILYKQPPRLKEINLYSKTFPLQMPFKDKSKSWWLELLNPMSQNQKIKRMNWWNSSRKKWEKKIDIDSYVLKLIIDDNQKSFVFMRGLCDLILFFFTILLLCLRKSYSERSSY